MNGYLLIFNLFTGNFRFQLDRILLSMEILDDSSIQYGPNCQEILSTKYSQAPPKMQGCGWQLGS
jgi:hypothetical protein